MKNIIDSLKWRYATKKFDSNKKIDNETYEMILETLRLSPSSYGLQPWKFILVNNKETREKISAIGNNQPQLTEASHLIVFANKKNIDDNLVDEYISFVAKEKGVDPSNLKGFADMIKGSFSNKTDVDLRNWASRQVYLAAGVLLASCAVSRIDACPMEGLDIAKLDEVLGLKEMNLESKMIVAIGYRDESDKYATSQKIRFPKEEVFIEIN